MKRTLHFLIVLITCLVLFSAFTGNQQNNNAQQITGGWGYQTPEGRTVSIYAGNVFSVANYDYPGKKFISAYGGTWKVDGNKLIRKIEWNSADSTTVGTETSSEIRVSEKILSITQTKEKFDRLDNGTPGELAGVWIITGNYNNDKVSKRANPFYPRRTMKVLSGKYFHWIAYNVVTKQFLNAGGGTYTTINGKYTENIEFFTKTTESIGKSLEFMYSFDNGDWRHKGQKSTGGALDECWTKRETLEK